MSNYSRNLAFKPSANAKNITHVLYQNMGDEVAKYGDFDTRDGCTRWEITVHLAPNVVLAQANDS